MEGCLQALLELQRALFNRRMRRQFNRKSGVPRGAFTNAHYGYSYGGGQQVRNSFVSNNDIISLSAR